MLFLKLAELCNVDIKTAESRILNAAQMKASQCLIYIPLLLSAADL